jgi:hypothetical protein
MRLLSLVRRRHRRSSSSFVVAIVGRLLVPMLAGAVGCGSVKVGLPPNQSTTDTVIKDGDGNGAGGRCRSVVVVATVVVAGSGGDETVEGDDVTLSV